MSDTLIICYWDAEAQAQRERPANAAEVAEIRARQQAASQAQDPIPERVTLLQARLALIAAGLYDKVNASIAAMTGEDGEKARAYWEFAAHVVRSDALVQSLAQTLQLDQTRLDALFLAASKY